MRFDLRVMLKHVQGCILSSISLRLPNLSKANVPFVLLISHVKFPGFARNKGPHNHSPAGGWTIGWPGVGGYAAYPSAGYLGGAPTGYGGPVGGGSPIGCAVYGGAVIGKKNGC